MTNAKKYKTKTKNGTSQESIFYSDTNVFNEKNFFCKNGSHFSLLKFCVIYFHFMTDFLVPQYLIQNSFRTLFAKSCLKLLPLEIKPFMVNILIRIDKIRSCYFCKYKNTEAITPEGYLEPCQTFRIER